MFFLAMFILGIVTYFNIPVSLLPDIPIPEITVQVSSPNASARELENTIVRPLRQQLLQVSKVRDIRSETRDGNAIIYLSLDYGANTDLAFIEVNEKIDAGMRFLPRETERPRVIKASATDIPVFNLHLTLRDDAHVGARHASPLPEHTDIVRFMELSEFAESVVRRRFEQLSQVAMIDISGLVKRQVIITPDPRLLDAGGISLSDIESALNSNNVEPGSMTVRDGYYEYVVRFSSILRTVEDIQNIYIRKNDRIYQLKNLAKVELAPEREIGMAIYNGKRAIVLSVIKQSEEDLSNMRKAMDKEVEQFRTDFPEIEFHVTQNQTELLEFTMSNLQRNLILAFIFVLLVSVFFLKDWRLSVIIGMILFVSLVISLLFFYLFNISLNVISLTGLILASGNMVDTSIIAADNITQHRRKGLSIADACVVGVNEIIVPMLSSLLTTIAIFIPLIFMSGIAGALFFDQAFSVTVSLTVAYLAGVTLLPVIYKLLYSYQKQTSQFSIFNSQLNPSLATRLYDTGLNWVFSHKRLTGIIICATLPLGFWFFTIIPKERMPNIKQAELLISMDWNENIHIQENYDRCLNFSQILYDISEENAALVGEQQFALNREREQISSESQFYVRLNSASEIASLKDKVSDYFAKHHPQALITFSPPGTIFEKIFSTGEAELIVEYHAINRAREIDGSTIRQMERDLEKLTGEPPVGNTFQNQLNIHINREKLLLYNIPYGLIQNTLRTAFREHRFATLRSQQHYLPVMMGGDEKTVREILEETLIETSTNPDGSRNKMALSTFVSVAQSEDLKTITAGKAGEYIPFYYYEIKNPEKIIEQIQTSMAKDRDWKVYFSGAYFFNKKMINELIVILLISILLMFFILAAQFESFKQPLIILFEIPLDIAFTLGILLLTGHSLNLMSAIGIVVTVSILINDSILKIDAMNQLRKQGYALMDAIHEAGHRRLKAIVMTSLTSIVCMLPLLFTSDLGSQLGKPLAIAIIAGMVIGTMISLFVVPVLYWGIYRNEK
jgi:multidrug efflux pump subunit AcrB